MLMFMTSPRTAESRPDGRSGQLHTHPRSLDCRYLNTVEDARGQPRRSAGDRHAPCLWASHRPSRTQFLHVVTVASSGRHAAIAALCAHLSCGSATVALPSGASMGSFVCESPEADNGADDCKLRINDNLGVRPTDVIVSISEPSRLLVHIRSNSLSVSLYLYPDFDGDLQSCHHSPCATKLPLSSAQQHRFSLPDGSCARLPVGLSKTVLVSLTRFPSISLAFTFRLFALSGSAVPVLLTSVTLVSFTVFTNQQHS